MLNTSDISSCREESLGFSVDCIVNATTSSFPLAELIQSVATCEEAVGFACRELDQVADDSCADTTHDYLSCLIARQIEGCDSVDCVDVLPGAEEDSFVEFIGSSWGKLLIALLSVALLIFLDFSCEKRFLCLRFCFGERRRAELNRKQGEQQGEKQPTQQLPTISEDHSPSTSEEENVQTQRIESLRNKRRGIESWLEHQKQASPEKQAPPSSASRGNNEAFGFL